MVLQSDQQRVCTMLKDTITLLCKNGLSFKSKFSIEAVIGVTLDDDQMFHVSMSEIVKSPNAPESDGNSSEGEKREHRKRKRRPKVKKEGQASSGESSDESDATAGPSHDPPADEFASKKIKGENMSEEDDNDIVFVKQEMDDNWSQDQGATDGADIGNFGSENNFGSLSDMTLVPVSQDPGQWSSQSTPQTPHQYRPRMPQTSTSPYSPGNFANPGNQSQGSADGLQLGGDPNQSQSVAGGGLSCSFCGKIFWGRGNLRTHENWHRGKGYYPCEVCGKKFMATSSLQGHMSIHTGIKEFKCVICSKEFGWKGDLKKHMNNVHECNLPRQRKSYVRKSFMPSSMPSTASHSAGPVGNTDNASGQYEQLDIGAIVSHDFEHSINVNNYPPGSRSEDITIDSSIQPLNLTRR